MDVSIIIVNYNTTDHLLKCIDSIIKNSEMMNYEIIVVDNNSPDRMIENLPNKYPAVKFYLRKVNDGFGAGCNFGAKHSIGHYYLFINPDIIFLDNVILSFLNYMKHNPKVAICSGLLLDWNGIHNWSYGQFLNLKNVFKIAFNVGIKNQLREHLTRVEVRNNQPFEIDYTFAALMFIRQEIFNIVKGFDERFFLYSEDMEIQYRIKKLGYKIICLPFVKALHFYGSSVDNEYRDDLSNYYIDKSKTLYMALYFKFFERSVARLLFIIGTVSRMLYLPFNKKYKNTRIKRFRQLCRMFVNYAKPYKI